MNVILNEMIIIAIVIQFIVLGYAWVTIPSTQIYSRISKGFLNTKLAGLVNEPMRIQPDPLPLVDKSLISKTRERKRKVKVLDPEHISIKGRKPRARILKSENPGVADDVNIRLPEKIIGASRKLSKQMKELMNPTLNPHRPLVKERIANPIQTDRYADVDGEDTDEMLFLEENESDLQDEDEDEYDDAYEESERHDSYDDSDDATRSNDLRSTGDDDYDDNDNFGLNEGIDDKSNAGIHLPNSVGDNRQTLDLGDEDPSLTKTIRQIRKHQNEINPIESIPVGYDSYGAEEDDLATISAQSSRRLDAFQQAANLAVEDDVGVVMSYKGDDLIVLTENEYSDFLDANGLLPDAHEFGNQYDVHSRYGQMREDNYNFETEDDNYDDVFSS